MINSELKSILNSFSPITLNEMDSVKLMNRTDTKYFFHITELVNILKETNNQYKVLTINNKNIASYKTLYFDTDDFFCYTSHHNGKLNRHKIRIRNYIDSGVFYFEHKFKNNKGRTIKKRIRTNNQALTLNDNEKEFIKKNSLLNPNDIKPKLFNEFQRITLVHPENKERITIDINLKFNDLNGVTNKFDNIVVIEIKKGNSFEYSIMKEILLKKRIRPSGFSKYCMGVISVYNNIKYNSFKERFLLIKKLNYVVS